jgi:hypothetical protein
VYSSNQFGITKTFFEPRHLVNAEGRGRHIDVFQAMVALVKTRRTSSENRRRGGTGRLVQRFAVDNLRHLFVSL